MGPSETWQGRTIGGGTGNEIEKNWELTYVAIFFVIVLTSAGGGINWGGRGRGVAVRLLGIWTK